MHAAWEHALNPIVYRLYHLTPAEIALIEQGYVPQVVQGTGQQARR